jgi:undecaprenyl-diphosphatase
MDARIVVWVATHRVGFLNPICVGLGNAERLGLLWIAAALVIGWARRCGLWATLTLALCVGLATFAADAASFAVKDLTHRTRPFVAHPEIHPLYVVHSSSFPAGHAATAFAGATLIAYVVPRALPLLAAAASLIAFSRVYVGVHYPTDVLAGAAIGIAVGGVAVLLLRWLRGRKLPLVEVALRGPRGTSGMAPNVSS